MVTPTLCVVILTHNEELNLPHCLQSIRALACDIFVVDSGSTDRTREIARAAGANVFEHPFVTHARQWSWALKNLPIKSEWVLGLDADQSLTAGLADEIRALFGIGLEDGENVARGGAKDVDGFYVKRRQIFRGKWIRHGGYYPKYLLKLFRLAAVQVDPDEGVDHHFHVGGRVGTLQNDLIEHNRKENDICFWIDKHNRYAALLALDELAERSAAAKLPQSFRRGTADERAFRLKRIWRRLPLYVRPAAYFVYRYFLRLGFLDGKNGFVFHFMHALWFRMLVDVKLDELKQAAGVRAPAPEPSPACAVAPPEPRSSWLPEKP